MTDQPPDPPPRPRVVSRTDTPRPSSPYEQTHEGGGLTIRRRPAPQPVPRVPPRPVGSNDSNSATGSTRNFNPQ